MKDTKVTVITPSYNQGDFLEETIQSVLQQTYSNIEYIIIDGGSTDQSVSIIQHYASKLSYWVSEKDQGQADAINKGLVRATGELVCWINSDDLLYPSFVADRVEQFKRYPNVVFIYGDVDQGATLEEKSLRLGATTDFKTMLLTLQVPIPQQSTMWRTSLMEKIGYLEAKWHVLLDREYFMRIALHAEILYIPGSVGFFRNHELSKSVAEWRRWADELELYYTQLFTNTIVETRFKKHKKRALASMYYESAKICRDCKDTKNAQQFILKSASNDWCYTFRKELKRQLIRLKRKIVKSI